MRIEWDKFELYTQKLLRKIEADNFKPEVIVAIGLSGFIPATIVAKALNVKHIETLSISSYDRKNKRRKSEVTSNRLSSFLTGKKVLCIDDIVSTGETMELAKKQVLLFGPKECKFAVPVVSEYVCKKYPDYWGESILRAPDDFISFFWD
ncbi:MAG: phosphoribosyltransferase family protein [Candidatus Moraniibacteriota bacterium]